MKEKDTTFAQKLKQLRKEKGYTQVELAGILSTHEVTIQRWEYGKRTPDKLKQKLVLSFLENLPKKEAKKPA